VSPNWALLVVPKTSSVDRALQLLNERFRIPAFGVHQLARSIEQAERLERALTDGDVSIVVAGEETVHGMHLKNLQHVLLSWCPKEPSTYLHVAGRTGRAGAAGTVTMFVPHQYRSSVDKFERFLNIHFEEMPMSDVTTKRTPKRN
jgi:superfamily II DNA/RNA helicase